MTTESGKHVSIIGKVVDDDAVPTHTMSGSVPVRIDPAVAALGFDKVEEEKAVCDLRNISPGEVKKRYKISNVGMVLSAIGVAFFVYNDKKIDRIFRFSMSAPFGLWIGYYLSAKAGICGISATGEWDPDNRGIRRAPVEIAKKLWSKAKKVHAAQSLIPILLAAAFVVSPV